MQRLACPRAWWSAFAVLLVVGTACGSGSDDRLAGEPAPSSTTSTAPVASQGPPPWLVAVSADNRLVVLDTATGEELRELVRYPAPDPAEPVAASISLDGVDVSPDRAWAWFAVCCEPAGGAVARVRVEGGAPEQAANGYDPTFAADENLVATAEIDGLALNHVDGDDRRWRWGEHNGTYQDVALSVDGHLVAVRVGTPGPGALLWLRADEIASTGEGQGPAPRRMPGDAWTDPTFRADGRLVVAEHVEGRSVGRVVDLEANEILLEESIDYGGDLLDQDHDATGRWLLATVAVLGERAGGLRWWGPDGATGEVPGRFVAAAW